jgi:energy-coupling factor transporter transmembrane protein EcfT
MGFLINLIKAIILAPFKIIKFVSIDIVFGIIAGVFSLVKGTVKMIFKPFTLLLLACGAAVFYFASEEQKKKVKELMGL